MLPQGARPKLPPAPQAVQHGIEYNGLTWLDFMYPRIEQMAYLHQTYGFHQLHLNDVLTSLQRPKIDDNDESHYLFVVLHFPVFNEMMRLPQISEVDIFVGSDFVVTAHDGRLKPLLRLIQTTQNEASRKELMARGPGYLLYRLVETLIEHTLPMLYQLDEKLDRLDERIFTDNVQHSVEELSFLRRDIISMRRIIKPNMPVLNSLTHRERPFLRLDEDVYFGDLVDELARGWDMLEEQKEIIEGLDATLSSLNSHRINDQMKSFTLISVIILPMTLFASILGMNVVIPFAEHPWALPASLAIMLTLAGAMYVYFRHRGWV